MSSIGYVSNRTTTLMSSNMLLSSILATQTAIQKTGSEISTGLAVGSPSDSPQNTPAILALNNLLAQQTQWGTNLSFAQGSLNATDQALANAYNLAVQAQSVGSSQIGATASASTRSEDATVINSTLQSLLQIGNTTYQGVSLFGGSASADGNGNVFESFLGGTQYLGNSSYLNSEVGLSDPLAVNSNGQEAFGALSAVVQGTADLKPATTPQTRIVDLGGATGRGVKLGTVQVTVDGQCADVDLSGSDCLNDVVNRLNAAIKGIDNSAGSVGYCGQELSITACAGHQVSIADVSGGETAADLGIATSVSSGTATGVAVEPKLTMQTSLASLGVPVDWKSGLQITQGATTVTVDLSGAKTIQDVANIIQQQNLGLQLQVNSAGTGLNLVSQISGISLSVADNGGTTAADLGLRTCSANTALSNLNGGCGIARTAGENDFSITLHNGTSFNVNLDGAKTVGDVVNAIAAAARGAGLTVGTPAQSNTDFNIGLASGGNGLDLQDGTVGATDFQVVALNSSGAASSLGIDNDAAAASEIKGTDVATVTADSLFTHLQQLATALTNNDTNGITVATSALSNDIARLTQARGAVGVRGQQVTNQQQTSSTMQTAQKQMLNGLQDADLTTVITQFTQLQEQLQGSLQVAAKELQTSLLNYLQ
jgi:flagellin-like hook-associated protein FlgL